jgi:hypothetical protein
MNRSFGNGSIKHLDGKGPVQERSAEDNVKLIIELSLHREELNIQNEELRRVLIELEVTKAKYSNSMISHRSDEIATKQPRHSGLDTT